MSQRWATLSWRHFLTEPPKTPSRDPDPRSSSRRPLTERGHSLWSTAETTLALLAIPLALLLIFQSLRLNYATDATHNGIEKRQEEIGYLVGKLEAITRSGREPSSAELKNVEQHRRPNVDGTFTLTKVIDVLPKQLPAKLTITGNGEGILSMSVRPLKFEGYTEYRGIVWQEKADSPPPSHQVEIEYPVGRYAVEFKSKDDDVTLDYKFTR